MWNNSLGCRFHRDRFSEICICCFASIALTNRGSWETEKKNCLMVRISQWEYAHRKCKRHATFNAFYFMRMFVVFFFFFTLYDEQLFFFLHLSITIASNLLFEMTNHWLWLLLYDILWLILINIVWHSTRMCLHFNYHYNNNGTLIFGYTHTHTHVSIQAGKISKRLKIQSLVLLKMTMRHTVYSHIFWRLKFDNAKRKIRIT